VCRRRICEAEEEESLEPRKEKKRKGRRS